MVQTLQAYWLQIGEIYVAMEELLKSKEHPDVFHYLNEMGVNIIVDALYEQVEREYRKWKNELMCDVMIDNDVEIEVTNLTPGELSNENNYEESDNSNEAAKKCSRLHGSTHKKKHKERENVKDCFAFITEVYVTEFVNENHWKRRVQTTLLENLIQNKKTDFEIESNFVVSINTIHARFQRKNLYPWHMFVLLPLKEAEEALDIICIQMGIICQLLPDLEGIKLMNHLTDSINLRKEIAEFQEV